MQEKTYNWSNRMRLGQVVPIGFGSILLLIAGCGVAIKLSTSRLVSTIEWVTHTYEVTAEIQQLEKILVDAETGQRGFIFTGDASFLEPYQNSLETYPQDLANLRALVSDNAEQVQRLERLDQLIRQKYAELAETIALKRNGKIQALRDLVASGKGKSIMDDIRQQLVTMTTTEKALLVKRQRDTIQAEQVANWSLIGGTIGTITVGLLIIWLISRHIIRSINQAAYTIASSSAEIAASVEEQERVSAQQASAVHETSMTMDELSTLSRQSNEQAEQAVRHIQQVLALIDRQDQSRSGSQASLRDKVGQIAEQILHLSEQTSQIGMISTLVSDLANQTNMLALNAAVEAVRAGEQGKGFGVVATEIRKLADQSKRSAERINSLVMDIQNATNSTVMVSDEGSKTVDSIVAAVNQISVSHEQIALAVKQQAIAAQQVLTAMNTINQGAIQTTAGISQTKIGTQNLNQAAQTLKAVV